MKWYRLNCIDSAFNGVSYVPFTSVDYGSTDSIYFNKSGTYRKVFKTKISPSEDFYAVKILKLTIIEPIVENIEININIFYKYISNDYIIVSPDASDIKIYDTNGKLILYTNGKTIDTSILQSGIYVIIFKAKNKYHQTKFIKK